MFDARLQRPVQVLLHRPAAWLDRQGVRAEQVTLAGFAIGLAGAAAVAVGQPLFGVGFFLANRLADGLDGAVARQQGTTDRGAFLDISLDFALYALFVLAFALADPGRNALAAAALLCAFMGTASSFLAFAVLAGKRGLRNEEFPAKGIHYLGGLTEGAETIAMLSAMCVWPETFPLLAWLFAAACSLTTLSRWHRGWVAFAPDSPGGPVSN